MTLKFRYIKIIQTKSLGWQSRYSLSHKNKNTCWHYHTKILMTDYSNHSPMAFITCIDFLIDSLKNYYQVSIISIFNQIKTLHLFWFSPKKLAKNVTLQLRYDKTIQSKPSLVWMSQYSLPHKYKNRSHY